MYEYARKTLSIVAEESGGQMFSAQKAQDLDGVYEKVLNDLSEVYSLGYVPSNDKRDRGWRTVRVELRDLPGQRLKTKAGYYAK